MLLPISRTGAPNQKGQRVVPLSSQARDVLGQQALVSRWNPCMMFIYGES
jgi:hypothetical protein